MTDAGVTASSAQPAPALSCSALDEEADKLRQFVDLLRHEQELLVEGNTDALLPLVERKNEIANALAALARRRENDLSSRGFQATSAGMESWLARAGSEREQHAWQALLTLAATARDFNVANGKLIGLRMQHNQQALNALMGATDLAMIYSPDGQQRVSGGRMLGTA